MNIHECQDAAETCKALGDYQRVMIIRALTGGERTVDELVGMIFMNKSTLVHHLGVLERSGLITSRIRDRMRFVSLSPTAKTRIAAIPSMTVGNGCRRGSKRL